MSRALLLVATLLVACTGPEPGGECQVNADCSAGATCTNNVCTLVCRAHAECPDDQICDKGLCMPGERPASCSPNNGGCHPQGTCSIVNDAVACACPSGTFGDGYTCTPVVRLVSVAIEGGVADVVAGGPSISTDGRYVVFESSATNLVSGDTNGVQDVFRRDLELGITQRVSVSSAGEQATNSSGLATVSATGRFVVFDSVATNLVPGDTNADRDVFVRDMDANTTTRLNVSSAEEETVNGQGFIGFGTISADGRFAAFASMAANLVAGDTNADIDVFVRDLVDGTTNRVNVSSAGQEATGGLAISVSSSIAAAGGHVVFLSLAPNLVSGDTNGDEDVFVRNLQTSTTTRVSVSTSGQEANSHSRAPAITPDGRYVAFRSLASNLVPDDTNGAQDVFVRDLTAGTTVRVSVSSDGTQANNFSSELSISDDGRYVAFDSVATNLVSDDTNGATDVFVHDLLTQTTVRASLGPHGEQSDAFCREPAISGNGLFVAFVCAATNFVPGVDVAYDSVFIRYIGP